MAKRGSHRSCRLPVFRLQQAGAHLQIAHPDSEHDFPDPERLASYEVIRRVLRPAEGSAPAESR